mgnify:CR=1 FL=1
MTFEELIAQGRLAITDEDEFGVAMEVNENPEWYKGGINSKWEGTK